MLPTWRKFGSLAAYWVHSEDWSDWTNARANLSLCWVHRSYCRFYLAMAQIKLTVHARTKKMFGLSNSNIWYIRDNLWRWKCSFWLNITFQGYMSRAMQTYLRTLLSLDRAHIMPATVEAVLTSTHSICVEQKFEKYQNFLSETFHYLLVKISVYLNRHVFVMLVVTLIWGEFIWKEKREPEKEKRKWFLIRYGQTQKHFFFSFWIK